jgi:hypothetical protein
MTLRFPCSAFALVLCAARLIAAAPANDNFNSPTLLTGSSVTNSASNVNATKEIGEPNHAGNAGLHSIWWKWTAPGDGSVIIQTTDSTFDTLLAVYTGSVVTELGNAVTASNDDSGSAKTSLVAFNVKSGITYHIAVDGFDGESGAIKLSLSYRTTAISTPPNDPFTNRIVLQGLSVTTTASSYLASKEPGEPDHADELGGASVWWTWTAPASGTVAIDTLGSDFDTLLAVYTGSAFTNLVKVASNDDLSTNSVLSSVTFSAKAGTRFQIAVDGFDGQPGDIQLNLTMPEVVLLSPPQILASGGSRVRLTGAAGKQYTLQASADLKQWQPVATLLNSTGVVEFEDKAGAPTRFYRALQGP